MNRLVGAVAGSLPALLLASVPLATARADCAAEIAALEQRLDMRSQNRPATESNDPDAASDEEVVQREGPEVEEGDGTTTYAEGGPAQPQENWFGDKGQEGKAIEERLVSARTFAEQGDEAACRDELAKVRSRIDG